jgi:hypothetical protein
MIKTLQDVLRRVEAWPRERQEEAARVLLELEAGEEPVYQFTDEEAADIDEALREIERGEVASEEEVKAVFNRYRA